VSDGSGRHDRVVGRGLTTRGRCLVAGGIAAVICAFVLDERDLLRVGVMAAALPLFAVGITALRRITLSGIHQVAPERLRPGTLGQAVLVITNTGQTRTPSIEISEPAVPGLTNGMRYLIAPIKRGQSTRIIYPIHAAQRGRFTLGPPHICIGDPFDLWEDNRMLDARTEVLVVPTVVALAGMPSSSGARSAASGRAAVGTIGGDPDIGVRQYRSGDDIRTIHWRASARHDDLMVRLEEPVSHGGATLVLDHRAIAHRGIGAASSLETAVVLAASISLHLLDSDHQVKLVSHRGSVIAEGHDISDDVLAGLAVLEPDPTPTLKPFALGRAGLVIAVLGEMLAVDARLFAATRRRGVNAVALVMATQDWDPGRAGQGSAATVDALRAADWRVVVVRPGDDLAAVWRRACSAGDGYSVADMHVATTGRPTDGRPFEQKPA
jgi:uncharacterized protein (DUF58 family)